MNITDEELVSYRAEIVRLRAAMIATQGRLAEAERERDDLAGLLDHEKKMNAEWGELFRISRMPRRRHEGRTDMSITGIAIGMVLGIIIAGFVTYALMGK